MKRSFFLLSLLAVPNFAHARTLPKPAPNPAPRRAPAAPLVVPRAVQPLRKTLPNGLTVLVLPNHAAPVVAVRAYVRTGSIYEGQYLGAGLSHLFEHTLFEGTANRDKYAINNELQAIGGQSNAYTTYDVTAYHIATATPYFARAVNLLADMLQNANFPEAEVRVQQGVIHNEMNLDEDDPEQAVAELWNNTAFLVHPVRFPIIGYGSSFDRLTRAEILDYYKTHYTPENTVLSVAGDVSPAQVFAAAQEAFGAWPRRTASQPALPEEPLQTTPRRAVIERDVAQTYLQVGWHTVPLQSPDLYALDVLASIMGGGDSSRLVRDLRDRRGLVSDISAFSYTPNFNAGSLNVSAQMPPKNLAAAEKIIAFHVNQLRNHAPSAGEVRRAQRQIAASFIFNNVDVESQAEQIALDQISTGDAGYSRFYVQRVQSVTPAQVLQVARKYLRPEGVTSALVVPRGRSAAANAGFSPVALEQTRAEVVRMRRALARAEAPRIFRLQNGLRVIVRANSNAPTVAVTLAGLGGARLEPKGKAGVAGLAAHLMTRDTRHRSAEEVAVLVDELGGDFDAQSGYNSWSVTSQWLRGDWRRGLNLVYEGALQPAFRPDELERARAQTLAQLAQQAQDPLQRASVLMRRNFYGADSPYGRSALGTPRDVAKITRADIESYWHRVVQPRNCILAIYGDVDAGQARVIASQLFGKWRNTAPQLALPPALGAPFSPLTASVEREETIPGAVQTGVFYGFPGPDVRSDDRYALDVLDAALSGASLPAGRIFQRLRDEKLVYDANAFTQAGLGAGGFAVYAGTTRPNEARARAIIEEELRRARTSDFSPTELESAKSMCIAARALENQTNGAQAGSDVTDELLGVGMGEAARYPALINAVTAADVRRMAEKYLLLDRAALAVAGSPQTNQPATPVAPQSEPPVAAPGSPATP